MAKITRVYVDMGLSDERERILSEADETDLRVLTAIMLSIDTDGVADLREVEEILSMTSAEFLASVKFWRGAGVLQSASAKRERLAQAQTEKETTVTAHKGGAVAHVVEVEAYTNDELAAVLENRVGASFVDEAQKVMGRIFNKNEVSKLVGLVDQLGFEQEAVLAILSYCVRLDKKSLSYAEKIALTFYDEDISTASAVHAQIDYLERRNSAVGKIQTLFGFGARKLSTNEKKYFVTWTEDWGFDFDVIKMAYEITVDAIQSPVPKYTNTILKKWYEAGLKTLTDVEQFIAEDNENNRAGKTSRTSKPKGGAATNTDVEDWLEQKLRKSFGDN